MRNDIAIIALKYLEPEYAETVKCIEATGLDVIWADRDGVGSMSRAFNEGFSNLKFINFIKPYKYVWFVTNITFSAHVPFKLAEALDASDYSAIHPSCDSDHPFLRPSPEFGVVPAGFIELMAPMFNVIDFYPYRFCEATPYWYMDLIISDQLKKDGKKLAVDQRVEISHAYLRNSKKHPITRIREQLRDYMAPASKAYMLKTYGADWEQKLRYQFYK